MHALLLALFGALLCVSVVGKAIAQPTDELVIIVNQANPVTELELGDVARIYLRRTRSFEDAGVAVPVDLAGGAERALFLERVLERTADEFTREILSEQYRSGAKPPIVVPIERTAVVAVARFPGGIAYVRRSTLASLQGAPVKVVAVVGALPAPAPAAVPSAPGRPRRPLPSRHPSSRRSRPPRPPPPRCPTRPPPPPGADAAPGAVGEARAGRGKSAGTRRWAKPEPGETNRPGPPAQKTGLGMDSSKRRRSVAE